MSDLPLLLGVDDARRRILALLPSLPLEKTSIDEAIGRALPRDLIAVRTLPPWDNSAMDGYAVRSSDVTHSPVRLRVTQEIFAGDRGSKPLGPHECARIMTGAPLPEGADAVVMQERARRDGPDVEILEQASPRQHVRPRGEDARQGEALLVAGTPVGIPEAGLLWAQGLTHVEVPRRPRVAIASTGNELCAVGTAAPGPDQIIDTNAPGLAAAVRRAGGEPVMLGIARDELADVEALFRRGLDCDVLLASAGVSVGDKDFAREAFARLGVSMSFWKVAIKPGKPLAVGRVGDTVVFGLPGNPTSSLVSFELFVRPALRRLLGHLEVDPPRVPAVAATAYRKAPGLAHFVRVRARWDNGALLALPLGNQSSGALSSASTATHLMWVPSETSEVRAGEAVLLIPLSFVA